MFGGDGVYFSTKGSIPEPYAQSQRGEWTVRIPLLIRSLMDFPLCRIDRFQSYVQNKIRIWSSRAGHIISSLCYITGEHLIKLVSFNYITCLLFFTFAEFLPLILWNSFGVNQ